MENMAFAPRFTEGDNDSNRRFTTESTDMVQTWSCEIDDFALSAGAGVADSFASSTDAELPLPETRPSQNQAVQKIDANSGFRFSTPRVSPSIVQRVQNADDVEVLTWDGSAQESREVALARARAKRDGSRSLASVEPSSEDEHANASAMLAVPGATSRSNSAAATISRQEELVQRFRCSDFLDGISAYIESVHQESSATLQKQVDQLRLENERLRKQFATNSMELPLAVLEVQVPSRPNSPGQDSRLDVDRHPSSSEKAAKEARVNRVTYWNNNQQGTKAADDNDSDVSSVKKEESKFLAFVRGGERKKRAVQSVFADIDNMKEEVRQAIVRRPYNVAQFYHRTGFFQHVARSSAFDVTTLVVISANSLWIAIDTDHSADVGTQAEASFIFRFAEFLFFAYFGIEWIIRFGAFAKKRDCLRDTWFVFDTLLVILMLIDTCSVQVASALAGKKAQNKTDASDTSVLKLLRMTKLTRMARMARLLRAMPELTILVKGIWVAARSVFFTLCLLGLLIYVFSVAFRQLTDGSVVGKQYFSSVPSGMKSLLLYGTLPDMANFVDEVATEHILLGIMLLFFILLGSLTVMNMLVGVLVEVVSVVSAVEKEEMKVNFVKTQLFSMLRKCGLEADEDMMLSRQDFEFLFLKQGAAKVFNDIGVDPVGFVDISDYIFKEAGPEGLTFKQFIEVVLQMRGSNNSTVKDIVDLRRVCIGRLDAILDSIQALSRRDICKGRGGPVVTSKASTCFQLDTQYFSSPIPSPIPEQEPVTTLPAATLNVVPAPPPGRAQEMWT